MSDVTGAVLKARYRVRRIESARKRVQAKVVEKRAQRPGRSEHTPIPIYDDVYERGFSALNSGEWEHVQLSVTIPPPNSDVLIRLDDVLEGAARAATRVESWPEWKRAIGHRPESDRSDSPGNLDP